MVTCSPKTDPVTMRVRKRGQDIYREVASERLLLAAPQSYLCGPGVRTRLAREDAHYPRPSPGYGCSSRPKLSPPGGGELAVAGL